MSERRSRGGAVVFSPAKRAILLIILAGLIVATVASIRLLNKKSVELTDKTLRIERLKEEIKEEEEKTKNLNKSNNKTTTDEDIEALARQELGLIKRDEIVIKPR